MTVGLAARVLEAHGIATCCFTQKQRFAELARPPRLLVVEGVELGLPLGVPGDRANQLRLVRAAVEFLGERRWGAVRSMTP